MPCRRVTDTGTVMGTGTGTGTGTETGNRRDSGYRVSGVQTQGWDVCEAGADIMGQSL